VCCRQPGVRNTSSTISSSSSSSSPAGCKRSRHRLGQRGVPVAAAAGAAGAGIFGSSGGELGGGRASALQRLSALLPASLVRHWPIVARLLVTLGMLAIIRCGYFIPLPGLDLSNLPAAAHGMEGAPAPPPAPPAAAHSAPQLHAPLPRCRTRAGQTCLHVCTCARARRRAHAARVVRPVAGAAGQPV
jgi:hypothetical protein